MADNKKTSIFNQACFLPSLADLQPVKIQLNNSVCSAFSPLWYTQHTHIQYEQTPTHTWSMDCDCCLWGMCFPTDSWPVSSPTFCFRLHVVSFPWFSPAYLAQLWGWLPVAIGKSIPFSSSVHFPVQGSGSWSNWLEYRNVFCIYAL